MPTNENRDNQGNQGRQPPGGRREMNHGREEDLERDRDLGEEGQDREVQSGGRGQGGAKSRDIKGDTETEESERAPQSSDLGEESEEDDGRHVQSSRKGQPFEDLDRPGGDGRVSQRADDRNDGTPDEPMPIDEGRK